MAGVLLEAVDADSRACTRSQVSAEYLIISYTSTFIRLSHLYQEFSVHCTIIMNDGVLGYMGDREWALSHSFFYLCFCLSVSHVLSLFSRE